MLLGLEVATTDTTVYQDDVGAGAARLRLRRRGRRYLARRARLRGAGGIGRVVATHVVRIDPADGVRLRGPFRDPAPPSFDILSVLVTTSDATRFVLEGNVRITRGRVLQPGAGRARRGVGHLERPVLSAERVEIKVSDD